MHWVECIILQHYLFGPTMFWRQISLHMTAPEVKFVDTGEQQLSCRIVFDEIGSWENACDVHQQHILTSARSQCRIKSVWTRMRQQQGGVLAISEFSQFSINFQAIYKRFLSDFAIRKQWPIIEFVFEFIFNAFFGVFEMLTFWIIDQISEIYPLISDIVVL